MDKKELVQITFDVDVITESKQVESKMCNGLRFRNAGDVDAVIGNVPLPAGSVNDDYYHLFPGEVLINTFSLKFKTGTGGTTPLVIVCRKVPDHVPPAMACMYNRNR